MQTKLQLRPHAISLLETMRSLIEKGWTQGTAARDKFGHSVHAIDERAVCWCLSGAFVRAYADLRTPTLIQEAIYLGIQQLTGNVPHWNDRSERTRNEVLAVIDQVLANVRE